MTKLLRAVARAAVVTDEVIVITLLAELTVAVAVAARAVRLAIARAIPCWQPGDAILGEAKIAHFAGRLHAIAADQRLALAGTRRACFAIESGAARWFERPCVPAITELSEIITNAVAAGFSGPTISAATVAIDEVAVVARFVWINRQIAAAFARTGAAATVSCVAIAVITFLGCVDAAIAAARQNASRAAAVRRSVRVRAAASGRNGLCLVAAVASLTFVDDAITAAGPWWLGWIRGRGAQA